MVADLKIRISDARSSLLTALKKAKNESEVRSAYTYFDNDVVQAIEDAITYKLNEHKKKCHPA